MKTNSIHSRSITLQQRLAQLLGARITTLVNPFGLIDDAKITKVLKSVIVVQQDNARFLLSPSGLPIVSINRRPINATTHKFGIGLNTISDEPGSTGPTIIHRRIVLLGTDFIETTKNGREIELIPLSNVNVIFSLKRPSGR